MKFFLKSPLVLGLALLLAGAAPAGAQAIRFAGVLGNSGVAGDFLVAYPNRGIHDQVRQSGLALDSSGFLWAFSGTSAVARYSPDGRQLASFDLPRAMQRGMQVLALAGDTLVFFGGDRLWSLDIRSPAGARPKDMEIPARGLSLNAVDGRVAYVTPESEVRLLTVKTGQSESRATLPKGTRADNVALLPDGTIYVGRGLRITPDGRQEPADLPGNATLHWANGHLYTFAWHTTIQRLDTYGAPAPGVVYGGSSGSFIGTLPKDGEMHQPSGIVHLGGNRYAATGELGVLHILSWDAAKRAFTAVRRIGAIHRTSGLGVDRQGRVWWNCGYWNWNDGPAAPTRNSTWTTLRTNDQWQVAFLDSGAMTGLGLNRDGAILLRNTMDFGNPHGRGNDGRYDRDGLRNVKGLPRQATGAAVLGSRGSEEVIVVDAAGAGVRLRVDAEGNVRGQRATVALKLNNGSPAITSLAVLPGGERLLAADGNAVVELSPDGDSFAETARHTGWGRAADTQFGAKIWIDTDGDAIWVGDADNNRVLLLSFEGARLKHIATFAGDAESGPLDQPQRISARAGRAVCVDWGNQRLVKLETTAR